MARRPTLIYDGDCKFCARWVERWRVTTGERVRYITSQEATEQFPEISEQESNEAVQWMGADGERLSGAPAVFAALATASASGRTLLSLYNERPWFARVADTAYRAVARNRMFFSRVTRFLWGADVRVPTFAISSWLFLRLLGVVYLLAFSSYWVQLSGLNGAKGILPAAEFFDRVREILGDAGFLQFPSICWLGAGEAALYAWCGAGIVAALALDCWIRAVAVPGIPLVRLPFADYRGTALLPVPVGYSAARGGIHEHFSRATDSAFGKVCKSSACRTLLNRLAVVSTDFRFRRGQANERRSRLGRWDCARIPLFHAAASDAAGMVCATVAGHWQTISVWMMFAIELVLPFFLFAPRRADWSRQEASQRFSS